MELENLVATSDPLKISWLGNNLTTGYNAAIPWLAPIAPMLAIVLVILLALYFDAYRKEIISLFARTGCRIKTFAIWLWEGNPVGKLRREQQRERGQDIIVDWLEGEVETGTMTRKEAREWYAEFCKAFPALKQAWKNSEPASVKEAVADRIASTDRDTDGKVIPVNIPGFTRKKESASTVVMKVFQRKIKA